MIPPPPIIYQRSQTADRNAKLRSSERLEWFFKSVLLNAVKVKQVAKSCFEQNDNNQHTKQKNTHK